MDFCTSWWQEQATGSLLDPSVTSFARREYAFALANGELPVPLSAKDLVLSLVQASAFWLNSEDRQRFQAFQEHMEREIDIVKDPMLKVELQVLDHALAAPDPLVEAKFAWVDDTNIATTTATTTTTKSGYGFLPEEKTQVQADSSAASSAVSSSASASASAATPAFLPNQYTITGSILKRDYDKLAGLE